MNRETIKSVAHHPRVHDSLSHQLPHEFELGTDIIHDNGLGAGTQGGWEQACRTVNVLEGGGGPHRRGLWHKTQVPSEQHEV